MVTRAYCAQLDVLAGMTVNAIRQGNSQAWESREIKVRSLMLSDTNTNASIWRERERVSQIGGQHRHVVLGFLRKLFPELGLGLSASSS